MPSSNMVRYLDSSFIQCIDAESRTQHVDGSRSLFSSLKYMPLSGSKSKNVPFQAHFLASRRIVDVDYLFLQKRSSSSFHKKKRVKFGAQNPSTSRRTPISEKLLEANRRMEAIKKAVSGGRIVAREDDVDADIIAAITKANCSECHGLGVYGTFLRWHPKR